MFLSFIQAKNTKICSACFMFASFTGVVRRDLVNPYKVLFMTQTISLHMCEYNSERFEPR